MTFSPNPYHYLWHDSLLFFIGVGISIAAFIICFMNKQTFEKTELNSTQSPRLIIFPSVMLMTTIIFLVFQSLVQHSAPMMATSDEYCRASYALDWARKPFFATADHIWLAGQFYVIGTMYKIFGSLEFATRFVSVVGTALVAASATNLGALLSRNRLGAFVCGLFASLHWINLWASTSAMAEALFYPAILIAMNFWVAGWQVDKKTDPIRCEWLFFFSALFVGFGNMFRYESWYFGIPFGMYLIIRILLSFRNASFHTLKSRLIIIGSVAVIAAYPLSHMLSAWIKMGSPFASFANNIQINDKMNLFYESGILSRLMAYPNLIWTDHWYFLPTMIAGLILCLMFYRKEKSFNAFHLAIGVVFILSLIITSKSGIGSNNRPRFAAFFILLLSGYSAITVAAIATINRRTFRILGVTTILIFSGIIVGNNYIKASTRYPNDWNLTTTDANFIMRLKFEHNMRYNTDYDTKIHPKNFVLKMYSLGDPSQLWAASFHSHDPDMVQYIWNEEQFVEEAKRDQDSVSFAIKIPYTQDHGLEQHYEKVIVTEGWEVWQSKN